MILRPPLSTLFPYTTLFRSLCYRNTTTRVFHTCIYTIIDIFSYGLSRITTDVQRAPIYELQFLLASICSFLLSLHGGIDRFIYQDRKSTRLNSSHVKISYAV